MWHDTFLAGKWRSFQADKGTLEGRLLPEHHDILLSFEFVTQSMHKTWPTEEQQSCSAWCSGRFWTIWGSLALACDPELDSTTYKCVSAHIDWLTSKSFGKRMLYGQGTMCHAFCQRTGSQVRIPKDAVSDWYADPGKMPGTLLCYYDEQRWSFRWHAHDQTPFPSGWRSCWNFHVSTCVVHARSSSKALMPSRFSCHC